ncbi:beta strand repeat-containing protein [Nioella sp.]|uniref:beta strand repeat-containing protein n=1 Tax=Nioella sp. TaxID=1912091 RepID=UPI003B526D96
MPSITLQGFETDNNTQINGDNAYVGTSTLTLTISEGASLIYSIIPNSETIGNGQILEADIVPVNGAGDVRIDGMATSVDLTWVFEASFSNGSSATILVLQNSATGREYFYPIDGNLAIPTSQAEWDAINASFTGASYATGTYAPNTAFDPLTFPNGTVTVDDYWVGYDDPELFNGGAGDDDLSGQGGNDTITGGAGDDYIRGGQGDDSLDGGDDYDQVVYDDATSGVTVNLVTGTATGGAGNDTIANFEMVRGSMHDDHITGDSGSNQMRGLDGNDTLIGGDGNDRVRYDRDANYGGAAGVNVNLMTGIAIDGFGDTDSLSGFERVMGSNSGDTIIGDDQDNELDGLDGNDTIAGGGGRDNIRGGDGNDTLDASGGDSASQGYGDIIQGGTGNNTIIGHAQAFADRSGGGIDVIYENVAGTGGVVITVGANGTGTTTSNNAGVVNDTFTYADHFEGTQDADVFNGSNGGSGTGQGNESWVGEAGNDTINGNGGWDMVQYWLEGGTNGVNVNLATGVATDSYGDTDSLSGIEGVAGTDRNDTLIGDGNDNYFEDRGGDDSINAAGGNDWIRLNSGSDTVDGGDGFDTLEIDLNGFTLPAGFVYQLDLTTGYSGQLGNPNLSDSISNVEALMLRGSYDAQVTGDAEDNRFETGTGNDTLTGGAGEDSFIYNGGADVITDFNGDLIGISSSIWTGTDAQLIADATVVSGNLVLDFGGGNTLTLNGITDASVLQGRILGAATPDVISDVTGDGTSDILWRNGTTGQYGMFDMAGGTPTWSVLGGESTAWQIGGLGDFDGDGTDDILWRNDTSGGIGFSAMGTGSPVWNALGTASAAWQIMGVGDFNGDGTDDILWQNSNNGGVGMFAMSGGSASWQTIGGSSAPWEIVATGDITGDGIDDIIWRNATTGQVGQFEMSSAGTPTWSVVANVSNDWRLVGTGDLDGDGTDDLLWRHETSGAVGYYAMGSGSPVWQGLGQASFDWDIVGVGDYNGDGTDDILWRNVNTGTVGMYDMDGGPSWQTIGQAGLVWDVEGQFVDEFVF